MIMSHRTSVWRILLLFLLAWQVFSACTRQKHFSAPEDSLVIYPPPPAEPKIQYLTSFTSSSDVSGNRSAFMNYIMGKPEDHSIVKPYGVATGKGRIYICDSMLGGLEIIDLRANRMSSFTPGGLGALKKPINCAVDRQGNLYVADSDRRQIVIFDAAGKYQKSLGGAAESKPTDVFVTTEKIWVCDVQKRKIMVYDQNSHAPLDSIPATEINDAGELYSPTNIYLTDEHLYVSDMGDFRVKVYTHSGEFVRSVGSFGKNAGQFVRPKGVAADRENNLFVVDAGFENVQIFNPEGRLLLFFGGSYKKPGDMWLPAKVHIDYENLDYFAKYVHKSFKLKYLIFVTNQYGPDKINVYGFVERKNDNGN